MFKVIVASLMFYIVFIIKAYVKSDLKKDTPARENGIIKV